MLPKLYTYSHVQQHTTDAAGCCRQAHVVQRYCHMTFTANVLCIYSIAKSVQCWTCRVVDFYSMTAVGPALTDMLVSQFWELDNDHDFLISKEDLIRYGNHSLTYRIVERIFQQVSLPSSSFTSVVRCRVHDCPMSHSHCMHKHSEIIPTAASVTLQIGGPLRQAVHCCAW